MGHVSRPVESWVARTRQIVLAIVMAVIAWLSAANPALALELIVDTTIDSATAAFQVCNPNPAVIDCSLRGAILKANAVAGPHTITLPAGNYVTATGATVGANEDGGLTGDLDIAQNITINGAGAANTVVTLDESVPLAQRDRLFHVLPAPTFGNLTIRDVSIRRGGSYPAVSADGGGVLAEGPLTMERVWVRLNQQAYGGGVYVQNSAVIRDSLFDLNGGFRGSGLEINGFSASSSPVSIQILNSTISTNTASDSAGGIYFHSVDVNTMVTLNNVTIAVNQGGAAGGLAQDGVGNLLLRNTIVASNTATSSNPNCSGSIQSQGYNLVFGGDTCGMSVANGDIVNTGDPLLSPLQGNGGPTATHALRFGSAALDQGNAALPGSGGTACEANDQRGLPRTIDGDGDGIVRCDIGAVEGGQWYAVDTTVDSNDPSFQVCDTDLTNGNCSLRGAISKANLNNGVSTVITLPATGAGNPYRLTLPGAGEDSNATGDLDVKSDVTIVGGGASSTIVEAGPNTAAGLDRVFHVIDWDFFVQLRLQDLTVQNGNAGAAGGGGIFAERPFSLLRVRLRANTARNGGGIFLLSRDGTIADSMIGGNVATSGGLGGGGIAQSTSGTLTIANSTIAQNQSATSGGGLLQFGGATAANLMNVTIAGNSSSGGGGVLQAGAVSVVNTIIASNSGGASPNCGGGGTPTSQGYNLVFGGGTCGFTLGTDRQNQDPNLGALAFNGGPTETMALTTGSAAIDAGNTLTPGSGGLACAAMDQRGTARPIDGDLANGPRCDIGAYEAAVCTLRLPVHVAVARNGSGALTVTVTAGGGALVELRFKAAGSTNALVDIPGQPAGQSGTFTYTVPGAPGSLAFTLRRASGAGAATEAFDVVDGCGVWHTFAGGGPSAF